MDYAKISELSGKSMIVNSKFFCEASNEMQLYLRCIFMRSVMLSRWDNKELKGRLV